MKNGKFLALSCSVVVSALLFFSGCGGSGTPKKLVLVPESHGEAIVEVVKEIGTLSESNISVEGNNTEGKIVATANVIIPEHVQPKDARGNSACVKKPCQIKAVQKCVKKANECSQKTAQQLVPEVPGVGDDEVALFAGTMDISSDAGTLTKCGLKVNIKVPDCVKYELSPRPDKLVGVPGCTIIKIWVMPKCSTDLSQGRWVEGTVSKCRKNGKRYVRVFIDNLPAHITMFAIINKKKLTGGSK